MVGGEVLARGARIQVNRGDVSASIHRRENRTDRRTRSVEVERAVVGVMSRPMQSVRRGHEFFVELPNHVRANTDEGRSTNRQSRERRERGT